MHCKSHHSSQVYFRSQFIVFVCVCVGGRCMFVCQGGRELSHMTCGSIVTRQLDMIYFECYCAITDLEDAV